MRIKLPEDVKSKLKEWYGHIDFDIAHYWFVSGTFHIVTCDYMGAIGCFRIWYDIFSNSYMLSKDGSFDYGNLDDDEE